jgi:hypothetical protein
MTLLTPSWYRPLTDQQRDQLAALIQQATGATFKLPSNDTPAAWLCELSACSAGHVARMAQLGQLLQRADVCYCPRTRQAIDAKGKRVS